MKEVKFNIHYIIKRREFFLSILFCCLINILHAFLVINYINGQGLYIENSYSAEYQYILYNPFISFSILIVMVIPMICAMTLCDSDWLEEKRGTYSIIKNRLNVKKNIIVRFLLSFVIGFFISFFGFMLNYFILSSLLLNGNTMSYFQSTAFSLPVMNSYFLDNIRNTNIHLFLLLITLSNSFVLGGLSSFAYACSFWIKKRTIIYFTPMLLLVFMELIVSKLGIKGLSLIYSLQPFSVFSISDYFKSVIFLFLVSIILLGIRLKRKEFLP